MANPVWPGGLPQEQFLTVVNRTPVEVIRTRMDSGPVKMRRKGSARPLPIDIPTFLTGAQRAIFDTFFITTLKQGSLAFDWEDPRDDSTVEYRFRIPTTWNLTDGDSVTDDRRWRGMLRLELMP